MTLTLLQTAIVLYLAIGLLFGAAGYASRKKRNRKEDRLHIKSFNTSVVAIKRRMERGKGRTEKDKTIDAGKLVGEMSRAV